MSKGARIPELILQRGDARGQRCKLQRRRHYRYTRTGERVRYAGPAMRADGTWTGRVSIERADGRKASVAPSSLDALSSAKGAARVA